MSPFLSILFLLLKRGSSGGGRRGWDFPAEASATFLWLGWGGWAILLSPPLGWGSPANTVYLLGCLGIGPGSIELGARDIHFPGTWMLGAPICMYCSF